MAELGENRERRRAQNGQYYWWNPKTRRLFANRTGTQEITNFQWINGNLVIGPGPTDIPPTGGGGGGGGGGGRPPVGGDHGGRNPGPVGGDHGPRDPEGDPQCPPGAHWDDVYRKCVADTPFNCPDDTQWDEEQRRCVPLDDDSTCPDGMEWSPSLGMCVEKPEDEEHECPAGQEWDPVTETCKDTAEEEASDRSAFAIIQNTLRRFGLLGLSEWAWQGLKDGKSIEEIMAELLDQPLYQERFAGNFLRLEAGLPWMEEDQYLAYEAEAMRLANQRLGVFISTDDVAQMIGRNTSIAELDQRLRDFQVFQRLGPAVRYQFDMFVGRHLSDQEIFRMLSFAGDAELERLLWDAQYTGQTVQLGLGFRPLHEAERLRQAGIDPNEAFGIYKNIARALPGVERLAAIEKSIAGDQAVPFDSMDTLFGAYTGLNPEQQEELMRMFGRGIARFMQGGGPVQSGTMFPGLETEAERRAGP